MKGVFNIILILFLSGFFIFATNKDSLVSKIDTTQKTQNQAEINLELSEYYQDIDPKLSLEYATQALQIANIIHSKPLIAKSNLLIGISYNYFGLNEKAIELLTMAVSDFKSLKDKYNESLAIKNIGNIFWYAEKYETAIEYYNEFYKLSLETNDYENNIKALISLGLTYKNIKSYARAIQSLEEAIKKSKDFRHDDLLTLSLLNLANVYYESGNYIKAQQLCQTIENDYLENIGQNSLPQFYNTLPQIYTKLGQYNKAEDYLEKAYQVSIKSGILYDMYRYYVAKYELDSVRGDYYSALKSMSLFENYQDSINNQSFQNKLANYQSIMDLDKKELEIEKLQTQNKIKDLKIRQNKMILFGTLILIALLFIIITLVIRTIFSRNKTNKQLNEQKNILEAQKEEISSTLEKLKQTQQQLVQSEKMASLGVLSAGIAHEINNPLNFIKGGIVGLDLHFQKNQIFQTPEFKSLLLAINEGVDRAAKIVKSLNQFSRNGDSEIDFCNIHSIIDNCLVMLQNQFKNKVEIVKMFFNDDIILKTNESRLHQVFINILTNAEQAIAEKGTITIRTSLVNGNALVLIEDNGQGIKDEYLKKITDPFFTTKEPGKGTGLGLSITYQILNEMGGSIEFESEHNLGTIVKISIPLKENYE